MQLSVRAMRPWAFLGVSRAGVFARPLAAQETGKIQGRVTDAASGQPIAGAQVVIVGLASATSRMATASTSLTTCPRAFRTFSAVYWLPDRDGPAAARPGRSDHHIELPTQPSAVEIAGIEVIGETRPLVPADQVASKNIVTGEQSKSCRSTTWRTSSVCSPA
jgi:hypothetical protein